MTYYVYGLVDPRNNVTAYVGITNNPRIRRSQHLVMSDINVEKNSWIQRLKNAGIKPTLKILDTVPDKQQALERERYWINFYFKAGVNLTNVAGAYDKQQFFKRLDDEWEKYQGQMALLSKPSNKEEFINSLRWFASDIKTSFPSKRGIISIWEEQKIQGY